MNNFPLLIIKVLLLGVAAFLAYLLVDGIRGPILYERESERRYEVVERKLEKIREVQDAYNEVYGLYSDSFDSLKHFIRHDSLRINVDNLVPKAEYSEEEYGPNPILADDTTKYLVRDSFYVAVKDSLFRQAEFKADEIDIIPFSNGDKFYLSARKVSAAGGRYQIPVYEVTAPYRFLLLGLNENYFNGDWGFQLGSISEANTEITQTRYPVYYPEE